MIVQKWRNVAHPDIRNIAWTKDEIKSLEAEVKKFGRNGNWRKIAEQLPGRTALQCFQKERLHL